MESRNRKVLLSICCLILVSLVDISHGDMMNKFGKFAEEIGDIIGRNDDCKFQCPNGARPISNPQYKQSANGCGSYGITFTLSTMPGMTECCNTHDYCYSQCNADKAQCDSDLQSCLMKICRNPKHKHDDCVAVTEMMYGGVAALGCDAYITTQNDACLCPAVTTKNRQKPKRRNYMYAGHLIYNV